MIPEKPTIQLRPYQQGAIDEVRQLFRAGIRKVIICLPTGGGKTVCFSEMVSKTIAVNFTRKTLILTHRVELLTQAGGTLSKFGVFASCLTQKTKDKDIPFGARCMVAMVETYAKRLAKFPELANYDLVIIDEADTGNFKKIFRMWESLGKNLYVVGATATPISSVKKDPLYNYYGGIVAPVSISELIEIGSLVQAVTYSADFNREQLQNDSSNPDGYTEESQMKAFSKREVYAGLIDKFKTYCLTPAGSARKTIVFCVNVEHSKQVAQSFVDAGYSARHVDGYMDSEQRTGIINAFDRNEFDILCNPNILTAGYDNPAVEVIVYNKATRSVRSWLQACGRGSRPNPGKDKFIILDMASNWMDLGLWQSDRDWKKLFWKKPTIRKEQAPPAKVCPACECINLASARVCVDCGYEFPKAESSPIEPDFSEITDEMADGMSSERKTYILSLTDKANRTPYSSYDVQTLIDIAKVQGYKTGWIVATIARRSETIEQYTQDIQELADWKRYSQGWVNYKVENFQLQLQ